VDRIEGTNSFSLQPCNFNERNRYQNSGVFFNFAGVNLPRYDFRGSTIKLVPSASAAGDYVLFAIPSPPQLIDDTDVLDENLTIWEDYIINGAAAKLLIKENSTEAASMLLQRQLEIKAQIIQMAANRDASRPAVIGDYSRWDDADDWYR
jgi:hypothetical protein